MPLGLPMAGLRGTQLTNYIPVIRREGIMPHSFTSIEVCAGAGGSALGLEQAGFNHQALVEIDAHACMTLRQNRPGWTVLEQDLRTFDATPHRGIDLLSGGVPCPPFSVAGRQLGAGDERDLFPEMIRLAAETNARAVMIENVPGLMAQGFTDYRSHVEEDFARLDYEVSWHMVNSSDYGVSQLRPRVVVLALRPDDRAVFEFPAPSAETPPTVGRLLEDAMSANGWSAASQWAENADKIAPTLVGGSKKHGGPDLGPTRAKQAWAKLGVNGHTLADEAPGPDHDGMPRLTVAMAALVQGFPADWEIAGKKTNAYRQVGNAFPPPVARAVGSAIAEAMRAADAAAEDRRIAVAS